MNAAGIEESGAAVGELELPEPRPLADGEVLIAVRAAGVGNWDEFVRVGAWDVGRGPPMALGVEGAGLITALAAGVSDWAVGDAVMTHPLPLRDQGTWSEQLIAATDVLARKPADASWAEAAAFPVPALTADQALEAVIGPDDTHEWLLVHGAGGVTGGLVVALARLRGLRVIATAGPRSSERIASLGAEAVLDYHDHRWPQAVNALTRGAGVSAAINAVPGGESQTLSAVADGARLATLTGAPPTPERGVSIANIYVRADGERLRRLADQLARGEIRITVAAVYQLAHAREALTLATRGGAEGAIVLTP